MPVPLLFVSWNRYISSHLSLCWSPTSKTRERHLQNESPCLKTGTLCTLQGVPHSPLSSRGLLRSGMEKQGSHPTQGKAHLRGEASYSTKKKTNQTQVKTTEHPPHGEGLDVVPISPAVSALNNTPRCIFSPDSYWNELMHSFSLPARLCLAIFPNNL